MLMLIRAKLVLFAPSDEVLAAVICGLAEAERLAKRSKSLTPRP